MSKSTHPMIKAVHWLPAPADSKPTRDYPDTTLETMCRAAGATVRLMWEEPGPKNTAISYISCYLINRTICMVQTFKTGGWDAFTPCRSLGIKDTVADVLSRCPTPASVNRASL